MALTDFMKSKFQLFVENTVASLLSILKIILLSKWFLPKPHISGKKEAIFVLGNGPSLNNDLEKYFDLINSYDVLGVNFFWKSPYFTKIKPKYYVIISENYWAKNQMKTNKEGRLETFKQLAGKVDWEMHLFVPALAKNKKEWRKELDNNQHISIHYLNKTPIEGFTRLNFFFFKSI